MIARALLVLSALASEGRLDARDWSPLDVDEAWRAWVEAGGRASHET